ncbi:MAG TPA: metalloregulator ArsR/SmtB family transcription factor [Thermoplasmata archaeon]|nr:metalloregulator ArsR/SmtB family transcription factor [Thermoplasmata archaeon]
MTGGERFRVQAEFCKAMAHPVRLEVIEHLRAGDLAVKELADRIGVSQPNLSQHLAVLRARGVVRAVRRGHGVVYGLANRKIVDACTLIREILTEQLVERRRAIGPTTSRRTAMPGPS